MKKYISLTGFVIGLMLLVQAHANSVPDFSSTLQSINTLSGKFKQTITDADGDEVADPTEGEFHLKRPGKFYWHTAPPYEQLVLGNDDGMILFDPDLEQVTVYSKEEFLSSPAAVLSGEAKSINEKYSVSAEAKKGKHIYTLKEKDITSKSFDSLSFTFKKGKLLSISLVDQMGQITAIKFNKVKTNVDVNDELFTFVAPEGADIIINE